MLDELTDVEAEIAKTDIDAVTADRDRARARRESAQASVTSLTTRRDEVGQRATESRSEADELLARRTELLEMIDTRNDENLARSKSISSSIDDLLVARSDLERDEGLLIQVQIQVYTRGDPRQASAANEVFDPERAIEPLRLRHSFDSVAQHASDLVAGHVDIIESNQDSIADDRSALVSAESDRDTARSEVGSVVTRLTEARETAEAAEEELADIVDELEPAKSDLDAATADLQRLDGQLSAVSDARLQALESQIADVDRQISELTNTPIPVTTPRSINPISGARPTGRPGYSSNLPPVNGEPLTGRSGGVSRPAIAVKIDNASNVRPQAGLNGADLIYEEQVEGGYTRFVAVFQSTDVARVGPVRSARTTDIDLLGNLGRPYLAFSGANPYTLQRLGALEGSVFTTVGQGAYTRDSSRPGFPWQNLMSSTDRLYANSRGGGLPQPLFRYGNPSNAGRAASGVTVDFGAERTQYSWNGSQYERTSDGAAHNDANGGRFTADNVIVQYTTYFTQPATGSPEAVTTGIGNVLVMSQGRLVEGTWDRLSSSQPFNYVANDGTPIEISPGRTHVILAPPGSGAVG